MPVERGRGSDRRAQAAHGDDSRCRCADRQAVHQASIIESDYLFAERNEVQIRHAGEIYRLRLTSNGKLILNK